jgi:glycosyltransferase involved in cell wall biosynthesis
VIIADDGSGETTRNCIDRLREESPFPLHHCWQEDRGFRAAESRNRAMAMARGRYLILIDGDILCERHFVEDHLASASLGQWIQGGRVFLDEPRSRHAIEGGPVNRFHCFSKGLSNRKNAIRNRVLSRMLSRTVTSFKSIHTANMSLWRDDAVRTNGFDERFQGWGLEDSDFAVRLQNAAVARFNLRHRALVYHLHHPLLSRTAIDANRAMLEETIQQKRIRCEHGLDRHL